MKKNKLIIINSWYLNKNGGITEFINQNLTNVDNKFIQNIITEFNLEDNCSASDYKVKNLRFFGISNSYLGSLCDLIFSIYAIVYYRPEVYVAPAHILPLTSVISRFTGTKLVLIVHDVAFKVLGEASQSRFSYRYFELFLKRSLKLSDKIFAVSAATKNDLLNYYDFLKFNQKKVTVLYPDTTKFFIQFRRFSSEQKLAIIKEKSINQAFKVGEQKIENSFILSIITDPKRKNLGTILRVFDSLCNYDNKINLVIIGNISKEIFKSNLEENCSKQYWSRVVFLGYVDQSVKEGLTRNAVAVFYPSYYEGFGYPVIESVSSVTIPLLSDIPVFRELVGDDYSFISDLKTEEIFLEMLQNIIEIQDKNSMEYLRIIDSMADRIEVLTKA